MLKEPEAFGDGEGDAGGVLVGGGDVEDLRRALAQGIELDPFITPSTKHPKV